MVPAANGGKPPQTKTWRLTPIPRRAPEEVEWYEALTNEEYAEFVAELEKTLVFRVPAEHFSDNVVEWVRESLEKSFPGYQIILLSSEIEMLRLEEIKDEQQQ